MDTHRLFLWLEGLLILVPIGIISGLIFVFGMGIMLMALSDAEYAAVCLQFWLCFIALCYLTQRLFRYLFNGTGSLKDKHWGLYLGLFLSASVVCIIGLLDYLFQDARAWEQSLVQWWPGKLYIKYFALGIPAVLPAVHVSYLIYKANAK